MKNFLAKFNFKLTQLHLFLILIAVLIIASLGFSVKEYFTEGADDTLSASKAAVKSTAASATPKQKKASGKGFESKIADLEDVIIPGRNKRRHHHDKQGKHYEGAVSGGGDDSKDDDKKATEEKKEEKPEDPPPTGGGTGAGEPPSSVPGTAMATGTPVAGMQPALDMSKYILKSEIVPPVCPKCPDAASCPTLSKAKCQPCKPCGRCPEPAFECKKVPNYNVLSASNAPGRLPLPRLNSFAQFN